MTRTVARPTSYEERVIAVIKRIPRGKVVSYGQVAMMAGNPKGARQVTRVLHSSSRKHKLPWWRVINAQGRISLPPGAGYEEQKARLERERVVFGLGDKIDLKKYGWGG